MQNIPPASSHQSSLSGGVLRYVLLIFCAVLAAGQVCAPANMMPPDTQDGDVDDGQQPADPDGQNPGDGDGQPGDGDGQPGDGDGEPGPPPPDVVATTTAGAEVFFPGCFTCEVDTSRAVLVELTDANIDPAFDDLAIVLTSHATTCITVRLRLGRGAEAGDNQPCEEMYLTTTQLDPMDATLVFIEQASSLDLNGVVRVEETVVQGDLSTPSSCEQCGGPPLGCCSN